METAAPEIAQESVTPAGPSGATEAGSNAAHGSAAPALTDIGSLEKFRFEGKEWTPKDLKSAFMMQSDYTNKTKEIAKERRFYAELEADLEHVKTNPALASEFKRLYPESFHSYLKYVLPAQGAQQAAAQGAPEASDIDPRIKSEIEQLRKIVTEDKVTAQTAKLEAWDNAFQSKYPNADIEAVYSEAAKLDAKGTKITEQLWESLYKASESKFTGRADAYYKAKLEKQKLATAEAKDIGSGGGTPGQAPRRPRLKDVADDIIRGMKAGA